jgi:hypothetical protein
MASANVGGTPHAIRWEFDRGGVTAQAVCYAEEGADCRLTSVSCACEQWGQIDRREDGTIWHHIVDYGDSAEPVWHQLEPQDDCNVCLFINESGCVEELGHGQFVIAETPIDPIWLDDGCDWEPTAHRTAPPQPNPVGDINPTQDTPLTHTKDGS